MNEGLRGDAHVESIGDIHYKKLSWVKGVDRKIRPGITVWHHEACRVLPDCDPEGLFFLFFYLSLTPMIDSFSCIRFISESGF